MNDKLVHNHFACTLVEKMLRCLVSKIPTVSFESAKLQMILPEVLTVSNLLVNPTRNELAPT